VCGQAIEGVIVHGSDRRAAIDPWRLSVIPVEDFVEDPRMVRVYLPDQVGVFDN
jgi:hypothetical protein